MKHRIPSWVRFVSLATLFSLPLDVVHAFSIVPDLPDTSPTSAFTQIIQAGVLSVDIVDALYGTVPAPSVAMNTITFGFNCQIATGIFGTDDEQIYVKNPDAADNGWVVSLAGSSPNALWVSSVSFDFNDPTADATPVNGCADGADSPDTYAGQMTVNPNAGTLVKGACAVCNISAISKGTVAAFNEDVLDSITILVAATASYDYGDWLLTEVAVSQQIPAEQRAASDYTISLVLSILAS